MCQNLKNYYKEQNYIAVCQNLNKLKKAKQYCCPMGNLSCLIEGIEIYFN